MQALPSLLEHGRPAAGLELRKMTGAEPHLPEAQSESSSEDGTMEPVDTRSQPYATHWAAAVERFGYSDALVFDGDGPELKFTYRDLDRRSNRLARNMQLRQCILAGDLVVTVSENRPELVTLVLACLKVGATFVPLATDLRPSHYQVILEMYEPKLIICDQPQLVPFLRADGREHLSLLLAPYRCGSNALKDMESSGCDAPLETPPLSDVPAIIFSTSGSTGVPKGVVYSDIVMSKLCEPRFLRNEPGDKNLLWVSMRGVGATVLMLSTLLEGVQQVMVDTYPSGPKQWAPLIDKHSITTNLLFGAAMNQFLQEMPDRQFPSLKGVMYGGSCFPVSLVQQSMEQFPNADFWQGYGMTEVLPISGLEPSDHKRRGEGSAQDLARMASAGRPSRGVEVFIEDMARPGSGAPPAGGDGVGQICARSPVIMKEYYKNPAKTAEAMPDGLFMRTGDLGKMDEDGFIHIMGRMKEIIPAFRGFNVAPRDIEEVLYTHPCVGEAAVVGILHPLGAGDLVVAWVTPKSEMHVSADELRQHLDESGMPEWQTPELINVSCNPLPTMGSKIGRAELQERPWIRAAMVESVRSRRIGRCAAPVYDGVEEAFERLDRAGVGEIGEQDLAALFADQSSALIEAFRGKVGGTRIGFEDWEAGLGALSAEECNAWVLMLGSLHASHERESASWQTKGNS